MVNRPNAVPLTVTASLPTNPTSTGVPVISAVRPPLKARVTTESPLTLTGLAVIVALKVGDNTR